MASIPSGVAPVEVQVERLLPSGLLVRLEGGLTGLIRERELAWSREGCRDWARRFAVGDRLRAVVLDAGDGERVELSLRLAEDDPWARLDLRRDLGRLAEGEVTGVHPYGVFVELAPGVTGLLRRSRLPAWAAERALEELFWVGDRVLVTIERVDLAQRQLGLSLSRALERRWAGLPAGPAAAAPAPPAAPPAARAPIAARVLVVEDDPEQLAALALWLREAGCEVLSAASGEAALEALDRGPLDLVLSDFGLPGIDGAATLAAVRRRRPELRCALMTDWSRLNGDEGRVEQLARDGVGLLLKPLRAADLDGLLAEQAEPGLSLDEAARGALLVEPPARRERPERQGVPQLLERLLSAAGASRVVLFGLDQARRKVQIVAEAGGPPLDHSLAADLIYSPVRDVAEDGRQFRVHDALLAEARVRYLRPLLEFRACLGLPVPVEAATRYALFLFAARPGPLSPAQEEHVGAVALAVGATIERQLLLGHSQTTQRLALLGQLGRALVHEINHHLGTVAIAQSTLASHLGRIDLARGPGPDLERQLAGARASHQLLARGLENLIGTAQVFGQVAAPQHEQTVDVAGALREVAVLVRDLADRAHVRLHLDLAPDLPALAIQAVPLQQILLNVVLNAIQQVELLRGAAGGNVVLRALPGADGVQVLVEDDGPGVHRRLWERVFELGFTTRREGGSGLGLYITRSLAESLGARVWIAESRALWGTTFAISLPAGQARQEAP
ncbi:MAG TPA: response regulator [Chloroflexaceae bacterium]|nr:response regulator [Chloroflexaceae bacterium]